jgi:hypothetical protein
VHQHDQAGIGIFPNHTFHTVLIKIQPELAQILQGAVRDVIERITRSLRDGLISHSHHPFPTIHCHALGLPAPQNCKVEDPNTSLPQ